MCKCIYIQNIRNFNTFNTFNESNIKKERKIDEEEFKEKELE